MTIENKLPLIGGAIAVVMLAAWWFFLWSPAGDALSAADTRYDAANGQVAQLEVQRSRLLSIQEELPQLQSRLQTLTAAVPDQALMSDFLLAASEAEVESGLDFLTVSASPPQPSTVPGLSRISVQLTGNGGYFQMLDFINRLQSMNRVMVIDNLTVVANQLSEEEALVGPPDLAVTIAGSLFMATPDLGEGGSA